MMKSILILSMVALSLLSCNTEKKQQEKWNNDFETAIEKAQNAKILKDTIFLNFRFGMSEKEVKKHCNLLLKNKKLYLYNNQFTYDFHTSDVTLKTTFAPEFFNDKLYKLTLVFEHDIASSAICMFKAINTFREKALSDGYKMYIYENLLGEKEYYFINQNIVIKFMDGMMTYTNQPIVELIEQEKKKEKESTINDF